MIDTVTRLALTIGALIVTGRALWLIHTRHVTATGRRLSVAVIAAAAIPTAGFWGYLAATAPTVGALRFDAYLSRVKDAWGLIALYTLLELIHTAEGAAAMGDYITEAIRWFVGVGSAAVVAVYLVRANRRKIESDEALNLSQAASNLVERFEKDIARLEAKIADHTIEVAELQAELDEQRTRRMNERDELLRKIDTQTARINALEAFIRLNTDVDPAHIT